MSVPDDARTRGLPSPTAMRLQWEPAQEAHVLLYPEGMVKLNGSAGRDPEPLRRGAHASLKSSTDLEHTFGTSGLGADVQAFVANALREALAGAARVSAAAPSRAGAGAPGRRCGCCSSSPTAARCTASFCSNPTEFAQHGRGARHR